MTDQEIAALLGTSTVRDDAEFRRKVIEGIYVRRQRAAALRRLLVFTGVFALAGLTIALLGQSDAGRSLLEPMAVAICLCAAAGELATWLIDGRSLIASRFH
jgi:hypothetical protein